MSQTCVEKIFINLNTPPAFQLKQKIIGDNYANLQYIFLETKASVSLRGQGSGCIEQNGAEANEPLHLLVDGPIKSVVDAKELVKNLIETIQQDLQIFLQTNQQTVEIQQPIVQTSQQQLTIPQAILSCPPPTIIQQPTHIIQQQNFLPQHHMQIIQQTPPPNAGLPIRTGTPIVQFQGQTGNLSQANIQLQSPAGCQQILLNQGPTQQYQLQYISSANAITNAPQMQVQHVLQPQQQLQSIIQQPSSQQQFITVQGNHFMIPPPNIIQQNQPQNIYNPLITIKPEELKHDGAIKHEGGNDLKDNQNTQQMATRILTNIPLNQPPPILNCPPPQIFNQQSQQQIQQFVVNTNAWPQSQQIQQLSLNPQIQIVTQQPQAIRSGNEIVVQNSGQGGQQVFTTFNSQQQQQQFQQVQFHQATITQPPPAPSAMQNIAHPNQQSTSFQQQFEQKINQSIDNLQQMRAGKRKYEAENEGETSKDFLKKGMGLDG